MKQPDIERYLDETRHVEGWFFPIDVGLFGAIDELQKSAGIVGDVFEIGVHHGKTAVFLARTLASGESLGVCDVFEQQHLNVDQSGEASRDLFLRHTRTLGNITEPRLRIFSKSSELLTADDTTTRCRFFHVDGGHRVENIMADLRTAERALLPNGIVAVDDVFNPSWPGVSEGFYRFIAENPGAFVPVVIGGNKVFLARPAAAELYTRHDWNDAARPGFHFRDTEWFGRTVKVASRVAWVDLDPFGTAMLHARQLPPLQKLCARLLRFLSRRR